MSEPQTLADRVKRLTDAHNAEFHRIPEGNDKVKVTLTFPDGTVLGGLGTTTETAFTHLEARVAAFLSALEVQS